uniref:flagellar motor switch protein FliN n=1 Tax=Castellaniella defragrans TaxID=75697 RepID=UPI00333F6EDA
MTDPSDKDTQAPALPDSQNATGDDRAAGQPATRHQSTQAAGLAPDDDDWTADLAGQTAAAPRPATGQVFQPLMDQDAGAGSDIDMIMDIPVQLSVELGRTRLTIRNILQLGQGSVVELDGLAGEPMDVYVNGYLIAQGEVVAVEDKYGIRITDIITPSDRIARLNDRQ